MLIGDQTLTETSKSGNWGLNGFFIMIAMDMMAKGIAKARR